MAAGRYGENGTLALAPAAPLCLAATVLGYTRGYGVCVCVCVWGGGLLRTGAEDGVQAIAKPNSVVQECLRCRRLAAAGAGLTAYEVLVSDTLYTSTFLKSTYGYSVCAGREWHGDVPPERG